jgi:hypothetical protein
MKYVVQLIRTTGPNTVTTSFPVKSETEALTLAAEYRKGGWRVRVVAGEEGELGLYCGMKSMSIVRPSKRSLGKLAEHQPGLLNLLVAYFVFEWKSVRIGNPPHGVDQTGTTCVIPDYVTMWTDTWTGANGVDAAVSYLLRAPARRTPHGDGFISEWLREISS